MRSPEEIKKEFTRSWIFKAEEDFRTSVHLGNLSMGFAFGAVFHAQQAVEKYLKAFNVERRGLGFMEAWYQVATSRKEVRQGRSFNQDESAEQVITKTAPENY